MVTVRGPRGGEQAWRPTNEIRVPFQPIPIKLPGLQSRRHLKNAPVCHGP